MAEIDAAKQLGQEYMVVTVPWVADPSRFKTPSAGDQIEFFLAIIKGLTLDDWKWNAEQFNKVGEQIKKAGLQLGYHNHNFEFRIVRLRDRLRRVPSPDRSGSGQAGTGLRLGDGCGPGSGRVPDQISGSLSLCCTSKTFTKGFTADNHALMDQRAECAGSTELGRGAIDYRKIFAAARKRQIRVLFVEQEPPFTEMPALEAIKVDYDYLRTLQA